MWPEAVPRDGLAERGGVSQAAMGWGRAGAM